MKRIRRYLTSALTIYLAVSILIALFQRSLIYHPTQEPVTAKMAPALDGRIHEVSIDCVDEITLQGWLVTASDEKSGEAKPTDRHLVIYFQGNAGHRGYRSNQIDMLNRMGYDVLIVDYRGYGQNPGSPSESAFAQDAHTIWQYATDQLQRPPEQIILFGESLGGGVATRLAAECCAAESPPSSLIIRCSFSSLAETAAWHVPWLPVRFLLVDQYPSDERIGQVTCPILIVHGDRDRTIPYEQAEKLFHAAPAKSNNNVPKQLVKLEGAGHNNVLILPYRAIYEKAIKTFLERSLDRQQPPLEHRPQNPANLQ